MFGTCTVPIVPLDDLPDWPPTWCLDHLGGEPVGVLFQVQQVSVVCGLQLAGGRDTVLKARADGGRAVPCVTARARLAEQGSPCARPLTPVVGVGVLWVHAEEFRPAHAVSSGGQRVDGSLQRPRGSAAQRTPGVPRCASGAGSRAPPPGQCLGQHTSPASTNARHQLTDCALN